MSAYEQGGPEARRQRVAKEQMCTLTMLTPSSACSTRCSQRSCSRCRREGGASKRSSIARTNTWTPLATVTAIGVFLIHSLVGLARYGASSAPGQRRSGHGGWTGSLVLCGVIGALAMTLGGSIGLSIGMMVLISGVLWSLSLWVGFLIRIGSLPARQSVVMVLMILLFNFTLLTTIAGLN